MYHLITQSAREVMQPENAPARTMCDYLEQTNQNGLTNTISIYVLRGETVDKVRLLYMNDQALKIWRKWATRQRSVRHPSGRLKRQSCVLGFRLVSSRKTVRIAVS